MDEKKKVSRRNSFFRKLTASPEDSEERLSRRSSFLARLVKRADRSKSREAKDEEKPALRRSLYMLDSMDDDGESQQSPNETMPNLKRRSGGGGSEIFGKVKEMVKRRLSSNVDLPDTQSIRSSTSTGQDDAGTQSDNHSESTLATITEDAPTEFACVLLSGAPKEVVDGPKQGSIDLVDADALRFTFREYDQTRCLSIGHGKILKVTADRERKRLVLATTSERLVFGGFQGEGGFEAAYYGTSQLINRSQLIHRSLSLDRSLSKDDETCGCGIVFKEGDYNIVDITITEDLSRAKGNDIFRCPILAKALFKGTESALLDGSRFGLASPKKIIDDHDDDDVGEWIVLLPEVFEDLDEVREWRVVIETKLMSITQVHLGILMRTHLKTFGYDLEYPIELCISEQPGQQELTVRSIRVLGLVRAEGVPGIIRRLANERLLPMLSMMFYESVDALQIQIDGHYDRQECNDEEVVCCPYQRFKEHLKEYWVWRVRPVIGWTRWVLTRLWRLKEIVLAIFISVYLGRTLYCLSRGRIVRVRRETVVPVEVRYARWAQNWVAQSKAALSETEQLLAWMSQRLDHHHFKEEGTD